MKIKDVMTSDITCLTPGDSLKTAAETMREVDSGFMPVCTGDRKLKGVVTDRDIVTRGVARGCSPEETAVEEIMTEEVTCCFANDGVEAAANKMRIQGIYRVAVLSNPETREFCGIISLGDILRHDGKELAASTASMIAKRAA